MNYRAFLDAGIPIFSLLPILEDGSCGCGNPKCKNAGKHPRASNWQHTPLWSEDQLDVMEQTGQIDSGYGVLVTGLLVIDVDTRNGGAESFAKLAEEIPEVTGAGLIVETGRRDGGRHFYMRAPAGVPLVQSLPDYKGIDFKSSGYVVGPGSVHAAGHEYRIVHGAPDDIEDAPDGLVDLLRRPERHRSSVDGQIVDISDDELAELLDGIPNDDGTDYEVFIRVGMAVHEVTGGSGFALWDRWAARSPKYDSAEMEKKWHSFGKSSHLVTLGTLKYYAESAGWIAPVTFSDETQWPEPASHDGLDISGVDLLRPPGFVGEIADWIERRNRHSRQHLAVAAALSVISSAAGMRYLDPLDHITPNLFAFGVAGSATGKETVLKSAQELLRAAGVSAAVHGGIKSEQEIYRNLIRHQAAVYLIDELGEHLAKLQNARKRGTTAYLEGVMAALLSGYSKANSHMLVTGDLKEEIRKSIQAEISALQKEGGEQSPDDKVKMRYSSAVRQLQTVENGIEAPYLCMFGLTTPERFDSMMDFDLATNGFLGRALIFRELDDNPRSKGRNKIKRGAVPDSIAARLQALYAPGYSEVPRRVERIGKAVEIPTTEDAADLLDRVVVQFEELAEDHGSTGMTAIPRRGYEQVAKISIILAIPSGLRTVEHVRWAYALVKRDVDQKVKLAYSNSAADKAEGLAARVLSLVTKEHGITAGVMRNKCRTTAPKDVDKCAAELEKRGLIRSEDVQSRRSGGTTKKYWLCS